MIFWRFLLAMGIFTTNCFISLSFVVFKAHRQQKISSRNVITISFREKESLSSPSPAMEILFLGICYSPSSLSSLFLENHLKHSHVKFNEMTLNNSLVSWATQTHIRREVFSLPSFYLLSNDSQERWPIFLLSSSFFLRCCLCLSSRLLFFLHCCAVQNSEKHLFLLSLDAVSGLNVIHTDAHIHHRDNSRNADGDLKWDRELFVWQIEWCLKINCPENGAQEFP